MNFNERLKYAMNFRGITQTELVKSTGISKSGISQYVSGEYEAKQDRIFLLAKALDVDPSWLMGKDVPMKGIQYIKIFSTVALRVRTVLGQKKEPKA